MRNSENEIRIIKIVGTNDNFRKAVNHNPLIVHFSGHGFTNEPKNFPNNEFVFHKGKGDVLVLEEENGLSRDLFERNLKEMIENIEASKRPECVFVSSCQSELIG